ncbi:MAG TPA: YggS family pyridoxal phosphate-dependent enzyme [Verrucomicrobiae bacterium]|nr:YggS family pyridoxal phosphate-dependent enzyme [Verrucomicrobiae bacterium]
MPANAALAPGADPARVAERLAAVRESIARAAERAGRSPAEVELLAVTKGQSLAAVRAALQLGLTALGENYVQECRGKQEVLEAQGASRPQWHLLGHCQRNKARLAAGLFAEVETVDSLELARRLGAARPDTVPLAVCCEVELTGLPGRSGFTPAGLRAVLPELVALAGIEVTGLMTVAAPGESEAFAQCRRLRDELAQTHGAPLPVLSMGMTDDFPAAIAAGSTRVRIGRGLFGPRAI